MSQPVRPAAGASLHDPLAGSKYRALREIGKGGWGVVYEVEHVDLRRRFAVKVLLPAYAKDPVYVERMRVEAQALGHLRSRHIVEVSDWGHTMDGRPYFVMPLLTGRTAAEELKQRGCLPPAEAIDLVQQLLQGLGVAHRAQLVHRDVKLDNLFLSDEGDGRRVLKILDFGVTKVLPGSQGVEPSALRTQEGDVVGTPRFMPPEQAMGREVGPTADLYGAGVALYELLTGRDPFRDVKGFAPLLRAHVLEAAPAPSTVAPQPIEPALDQAVMKALAKRPQDRYASAADFAEALRSALSASPTSVAGRRPPTSATAPARDQGAVGELELPEPEVPSARGASFRVALLLVVASAVLSALVAFAFVRGR